MAALIARPDRRMGTTRQIRAPDSAGTVVRAVRAAGRRGRVTATDPVRVVVLVGRVRGKVRVKVAVHVRVAAGGSADDSFAVPGPSSN